MSNVRERINSMERKDGPPGMTRLILCDLGDGRYLHRGTGRLYGQSEVDRLGDAALVIRERVVRKETSHEDQ